MLRSCIFTDVGIVTRKFVKTDNLGKTHFLLLITCKACKNSSLQL